MALERQVAQTFGFVAKAVPLRSRPDEIPDALSTCLSQHSHHIVILSGAKGFGYSIAYRSRCKGTVATMPTDKDNQFVQFVVDNTKSGKLRWEITADPTKFVAS